MNGITFARKKQSEVVEAVIAFVLIGTTLLVALRWAFRTTAISPVDLDRAALSDSLYGIGGLVAVFMVAQTFSILVAAYGLMNDLPSSEMWAFGKSVPGFNLLASFETLAQIAQIVLPLIGLLLTVKKHPVTPRLWFAYLMWVDTIVLADALGTHLVTGSTAFISLTGSTAEYFRQSVLSSDGRNLRIFLWATAWAVYWAQSNRVRTTFGHAALENPKKGSTFNSN